MVKIYDNDIKYYVLDLLMENRDLRQERDKESSRACRCYSDYLDAAAAIKKLEKDYEDLKERNAQLLAQISAQAVTTTTTGGDDDDEF